MPLDLKAELLSCLIWPESRTAYHGERCQEQRCHMKQKLSSTNSKRSPGNLYYNWYKEQSHLVFLSGQKWFLFGQPNFVLINKMYELLWPLDYTAFDSPSIPCPLKCVALPFPQRVFQSLTALEGHRLQQTDIKYVFSSCRKSCKYWNLNVYKKETVFAQFALYC